MRSFFFFVFPAGLGMIILSVCYRKIAIHRKVKRKGLYVRGTIVRGGSSFQGATPVIQFLTASGRQVEGVARNLGRVRGFFHAGDRIDLYYLPDEESVFVVDVFLLNLFLYMGLIAGSLFSLLALVPLLDRIA